MVIIYAYTFSPMFDTAVDIQAVECEEKPASYKPVTGTAKYLKADEDKVVRRATGAYTYFSRTDDKAKAMSELRERIDAEIADVKTRYDKLVAAKELLQ